MTIVDGVRVAPERVRPSYHPIFRAAIGLVEVGKPPTYVNIANELGCSKQAVSQMFQPHPDLLAWMDRQVQAANVHYAGFIVRRMSLLAIQGSAPHAEIALKYQAGAFARPVPAEGGEGGGAPGVPVFQMNFLIPRPEMPAIAAPPVPRLTPPDQLQRWRRDGPSRPGAA